MPTPLHMARLPTADPLRPAATEPTFDAASSLFARTQYAAPYTAPMHCNAMYTPSSAAYIPYVAAPQCHSPNPHERQIVELTAQLNAAVSTIQRLTASGSGFDELTARISAQHMPTGMCAPPVFTPPRPSRPPSPNGSVSMSQFATITSSSSSSGGGDTHVSDASTVVADNAVLPSPAGKGGAASASQFLTKRHDIFSSHELKSLPCSCERDEIAAWDTTLMARLEAKNPAAHKVLDYSDAEYKALPADARDIARAYDLVLGGHLLALVQGKTERAKLVRNTIAEREEDEPGKVASSGRAIRAIILEMTSPTCGAELKSLENELKKPFFRMGMGEIAAKLAARRMKALRQQLPASARGGKRELLRQLIEKFPAELAAEAKKYENDMLNAEVCDKPYEWSFRQLSAILAALVAEPTAEANAVESGRRNGGGNDKYLFTPDFKGCLHCGFDGHSTRECKVPPCGYCGFRFCFGIRKKGNARECLVKKVVSGGEINDKDVGFNGRPLPPALVEQLNDKAQKMKAAKETNSAEAQTEPNVTYPDDEVCEGESD